MEDRWLSVDDIATYLGITRDTVYAWIAKKNLPAHRTGRFWKFKREEVDEWVKNSGGDNPNSGLRGGAPSGSTTARGGTLQEK